MGPVARPCLHPQAPKGKADGDFLSELVGEGKAERLVGAELELGGGSTIVRVGANEGGVWIAAASAVVDGDACVQVGRCLVVDGGVDVRAAGELGGHGAVSQVVRDAKVQVW